jgi:hypothetical protein
VFNDIIESCETDLNNEFDDWGFEATNLCRGVFEDVRQKFNNGYLMDDEDEPVATRQAKLQLADAIKTARRAIPILDREIEKCNERS